ncbi:MAG: membrane protein insertase YidC [Clostridiaceae bacterium]|nr:membrane protein insertase YidC [Clostridiaceae bacterium]
MDFVTLTIKALSILAHFCGSYGLAIIFLTIIVRLAMWHLNVSQQRSMKTMQTMQPKLKAIQERYKNNPQMQQQKLMEFYKENNFNPMGGCLPLLIQMPIFILLYSALMSPQFIQVAGNQKFLFINRLDTTLHGTAAKSYDGKLTTTGSDKFTLGKTATIYLPKEILKDVKVTTPSRALEVQGTYKPGENIDLKFTVDHLDLKFAQLEQIQKAEVKVTNLSTKEAENLTFKKQNDLMVTTVPTVKVPKDFHYDILTLIILFGLTMVLSQKVMMATTNTKDADATTQAMQKSMGLFMPIMIIGTFIIIPIPAGVLLYLVTSNIIQIIQTVIINEQIVLEEKHKKVAATDGEKVVEAELVDDGNKEKEMQQDIVSKLKAYLEKLQGGNK